jgi:hypothetical protein
MYCRSNFTPYKTFVPQPVPSGKGSKVKLNNGTTVTFPALVYHGVEDLFKTILNLSRFT